MEEKELTKEEIIQLVTKLFKPKVEAYGIVTNPPAKEEENGSRPEDH